MMKLIARLGADIAGNVLVEVTVMMTLIFIFVLGGIDFLFAFYQYNAAAKAVERGARVAAVWAPVATGLNSLSTSALLCLRNPTSLGGQRALEKRVQVLEPGSRTQADERCRWRGICCS